MRAIQISSYGGPEVIEVVDRDDPAAEPGRAVVEVAAAGVNFVDVYHRSGLYQLELPGGLGLEGAGRVKEVGEGVEDLRPGDLVAWTDVSSSYAEVVSAPAERLVPVPDGIDDRTAAAAMLQGLTAHYLATTTFPLEPGHRCLVHAGAGGVGRLLIQIAKLRGAEVITTVGDRQKEEIASRAGADHVIRYNEVDFGEAVEALAGPRPLDVIYDGVGAATFGRGLQLLRPRGLMVSFGNASGPVPPISPLDLSTNGSLFLTRPTMAHHVGDRSALLERARDLFGWIGDGSVEVLIGETHPLSEAAEAHRRLEARLTTGKSLLLPD